MSKLAAQRRIGGIAGHLTGVPISISVGGVNIGISYGNAPVSSTSNALAQSTPSAVETVSPKEAPTPVQKEYSMSDVAKHNTEKDCWVIVNGQVLDVTNFLADHPGGKKAIMIYAGRDATEEFNMMHKPEVVEKYAPETVIGTLKQ